MYLSSRPGGTVAKPNETFEYFWKKIILKTL